MNESFDMRPLLERETLKSLQQRQNVSSLIRLTLQLGAFLLCAGSVILSASFPVVAACFTVVLGGIWASLFAPFHECAHLTAFRSRRLNTIGGWLSGILFGMAPTVYRAFHWEHHRYTQDRSRDPEIMSALDLLSLWPKTMSQWLSMISGRGLLYVSRYFYDTTIGPPHNTLGPDYTVGLSRTAAATCPGNTRRGIFLACIFLRGSFRSAGHEMDSARRIDRPFFPVCVDHNGTYSAPK